MITRYQFTRKIAEVTTRNGGASAARQGNIVDLRVTYGATFQEIELSLSDAKDLALAIIDLVEQKNV